uniref:Retrotransposon gag domain-containing protein n=1 Tax=Denticeps clupeoides TaxID=299321 RepID=A0AAY4CF78_9TELE
MPANASPNSSSDSKSGPSPDAAGMSTMQETLGQLTAFLQLQHIAIQDHQDTQLQQQRALLQVSSALADLSAHVHSLQSQPSCPGPAVATPESRMSTLAGLAPPPLYDGDSKSCRGFITQCRLLLRLQAAHLPDEETAVAYIITRLTGRALDWVTPLVERRDPICLSVPAFLDRLQTVFQGETGRRASSLRLLSLRQGNRSVSDYAIEFRTLASDSGWTDGHAPEPLWTHTCSNGETRPRPSTHAMLPA